MLLASGGMENNLAEAQDDAAPLPPAIDEGENVEAKSGPRESRWRERREMRREGHGLQPGGGPEKDGHGGRAGRMGHFLKFMSKYHESVKDPYQAIGLAILGIKETYRKQGKPLDAIPELEKLLTQAKDQRVRNLILFSMRQVYEEANNSAKVLELSSRIIQENLVALEKTPG